MNETNAETLLQTLVCIRLTCLNLKCGLSLDG